MSLLSDRELRAELTRGGLSIEPKPGEVKTASVEMHLGSLFYRFRQTPGYVMLDPFRDNSKLYESFTAPETVIGPGQFLLGCTIELLKLGRTIAARVDGKSTLGRLGLQVHCTAGFIDPGFEGQVTLELFNQSPFPILLRALMPIGQLVCERTTGPVERPYGDETLASHYQGSAGPVLPAPLLPWSRYASAE